MEIKEKIELTRDILNNAINMRLDEELILKISRKLDQYIHEYYKEIGEGKKRQT